MFDELIANHPLFTKGKLSSDLESATTRIFQGLGLPFPMRCAPRMSWGYIKTGNIYLPIPDDLLAFRTAMDMVESKQYHQEDVIKWLCTVPTNYPMRRRVYFNIRDDRPPFKEIRLSVEERIALVYGTSSTAPEKNLTGASTESNGQA